MHPFVVLKRQKVLKRGKQKYINPNTLRNPGLKTHFDSQIFKAYPSDKMYQISKNEDK